VRWIDRRGIPHFVDFLRNDVFFCGDMRSIEIGDSADMGRSSAAPLLEEEGS
jgi:hypothetical protein